MAYNTTESGRWDNDGVLVCTLLFYYYYYIIVIIFFLFINYIVVAKTLLLCEPVRTARTVSQHFLSKLSSPSEATPSFWQV